MLPEWHKYTHTYLDREILRSLANPQKLWTTNRDFMSEIILFSEKTSFCRNLAFWPRSDSRWSGDTLLCTSSLVLQAWGVLCCLRFRLLNALCCRPCVGAKDKGILLNLQSSGFFLQIFSYITIGYQLFGSQSQLSLISCEIFTKQYKTLLTTDYFFWLQDNGVLLTYTQILGEVKSYLQSVSGILCCLNHKHKIIIFFISW